MAFTPTRFLSNNTDVLLRDPQHAARLFVDDQFRLAPKHKFLFHVAFNINISALQNIDLVQRHKNEINMLVKACDLPSYTVQTDTLNQYNRKKNIQTKHTYNEINMTFHDDNMGIINQLWQNYYKYYYADARAAENANAYTKNATRSFDFVQSNYGLDNGSLQPFFNYITIYQMARHEYVSYKLINPIIVNWNHNRVDYGQTGVHDNTMKLMYEAVAYGYGETTTGDPEGFGLEHYDPSPSPLQVGSNANTSATPTFGTSSQRLNPISVLDNVSKTINTYQNTQDIPNAGTPGLLSSITTSSATPINGVSGVVFPTSTDTTANTVATSWRP